MKMAVTSPRHAYTLIELMLVMALIVAAAALTVPAMKAMLVDARISASGDVVRARMADTRGKAMEDGRPWKLGFIANSGVFQLAPEGSGVWGGADKDPVMQDDLIRDELPKDIIFALNAGDISGNVPSSSSTYTWETIGVYLPDGSARDDATIYFGHQGIAPLRMVLRGLTGAVAIEVPTVSDAGNAP